MEDTLVLPDNLLKHLHPRRDGAGVRPFAADPLARARVDEMLAERQAHVDRIVAAAATAEVAAAEIAMTTPRRAGDRTALADVWIAEHGLRFAAVAAVETGTRHPRSGLPVLLRVRAALASAPAEEFERVVAALAPYRSGSAEARTACSVLVPRPDWVDADLTAAVTADDDTLLEMLFYAASTAGQAEALVRRVNLTRMGVETDLLATFTDGVGPAVAPALFHWFDEAWSTDPILPVLAALPGDDVMRGLLARSGARSVRAALRAASERFPARALRILAEAGDELLPVHVTKHSDLVDQVMPLLSPEAAGRVRAVLEIRPEVPVAALSAVPPVLADPPWANRAKTAKPVVLTGVSCTDAPAAHWLAGEWEDWAESTTPERGDDTVDWAAMAEGLLDGGRWYQVGDLLTRGPEDLARQTIVRWRPGGGSHPVWWLRGVVARFGTDAMGPLVLLARAQPAEFGPLLMPFTSPEVTVLMADWQARLKSVRGLAQQWLLRHSAVAVRTLVPAALGRAGAARRQAERALLLLHAHGRTAEIRSAAAGYGPQATAGVEALFDTDPLMALPARMPAPPEWAPAPLLPPVRLRDGSGALPAEAVTNLLRMLMISRAQEPYAGLDQVRQAVRPADLAAFGWALFELWLSGGGVAKDNWVLDTVAQTGDDDVVRRITPMIMAWPTDGLTARAIAGLTVLVGIGTDQALLHLQRISQRAKSGPLRRAATARITEIADARGLTTEQLADRLVPDFGLDAAGSLLLDYGPRRFVVGFDEQLRPFAAEEGGRRLKTLPKPGARDDAERAAEAYQRFATLKKDVRKIAAEQVRRLEQAMVGGRRWSGAEFRQLFAAHPLMWHIGRRLVWARFDGDTVLGALRIAEDRTPADVDDDPVTVGDDDVIGLAHPVHLGADTGRWAGVFADYEILQPFPQLGRQVFTLTEAERDSGRLTRFEGVTVPTTKVLLLDRRGWVRHEVANAGTSHGFDRPAGPGKVLTVHLDPGIVGQVGFYDEQTLLAVYLHDGTEGSWSSREAKTLPLGDLDPLTASEIISDLTAVTT
ncbi:DUF4132 domain-containing protein [Actinoplanes couchii]|uniref:DUF4132 domain-containing protein n=1 Tax=Actinoplanes couchii TaxID=403638 RepID=UPI001EF1FBAC|nr:DUF4132 domain-containing protein [Actinoplanes couchii]MDR6316963.1 hypothetical protein [Actinoplanes couchii]